MTKNIYTVTDINRYIKNMFSQDFMMRKIYVKGEISNCKYHSSGHIYFTLKDESGSLRGIMFAGSAKNLKQKLRDGDQIIALGSIEVFEMAGNYQLYVKEIIFDGTGDLNNRYQELKMRLEEMGMFATEYKKQIPAYPQKIGIVTAPTGAAIRDIQQIALRRNPYVQLILFPALVQGEGAKASIVEGIEQLDKIGVDLIIVGRGGGSIEDLWAFNEEIVANAVFQCKTPIISAVGHETDTTIIDYVADMRAPTPSAAAELAVFSINEVLEFLLSSQNYLEKQFTITLNSWKSKLMKEKIHLEKNNPSSKLNEQRRTLVELEHEIMDQFQKLLQERSKCLEIYAGKLDGLSPLKKMKQGYSMVLNAAGEKIYSVHQLVRDEKIKIAMQDGVVEAKVQGIFEQ
jgi:exodeoxyribonuclease VII large subunit